MTGRRSRNKGAQWERDAAKRLAEVYPDASRGGHVQRRGVPDAADVSGTPWWPTLDLRRRIERLEREKRAVRACKGVSDEAGRTARRAVWQTRQDSSWLVLARDASRVKRRQRSER